MVTHSSYCTIITKKKVICFMNTGAFYFFTQLSSTNHWALQQKRVMPFFCIAQQQLAGRGRRLNQWRSFQGDLLLSYALEVEALQPNLSVLLGVRLAQFFERHKVHLKIKWPNDLILVDADGTAAIEGDLGRSKVGGILIESRFFGDKIKLVLGLGLNLSSKHQQYGQAFIPQGKILYKEALFGISELLTTEFQQQEITLAQEQWQKFDYLLHKKIYFDLLKPLPNIPIGKKIIGQQEKNETLYRYCMQAQGINSAAQLLVYDEPTEQKIYLDNAFNIRLA